MAFSIAVQVLLVEFGGRFAQVPCCFPDSVEAKFFSHFGRRTASLWDSGPYASSLHSECFPSASSCAYYQSRTSPPPSRSRRSLPRRSALSAKGRWSQQRKCLCCARSLPTLVRGCICIAFFFLSFIPILCHSSSSRELGTAATKVQLDSDYSTSAALITCVAYTVNSLHTTFLVYFELQTYFPLLAL